MTAGLRTRPQDCLPLRTGCLRVVFMGESLQSLVFGGG